MREFADLVGLDIRVGVIQSALFFAEARVPAYKLEIDFGPAGKRQTSAQLTRRYKEEDLIGRRIAALGLPAKRVAGFKSKCLVMGSVDDEGDVILLDPGQDTPLGWAVR